MIIANGFKNKMVQTSNIQGGKSNYNIRNNIKIALTKPYIK